MQGATFTEVHLLGTDALDRHRGYVGQSRATAGTHTWNTRTVDPGDHGGRLVRPSGSAAEEVALAMRRAPAKTFAVFDDPCELAGRLEAEREAHRAVLAGRPLDVTSRLAAANRALGAASGDLQQAEARAAQLRSEAESVNRFGRLLPGGRRHYPDTDKRVLAADQQVDSCRQRVEQNLHQLTQLQRQDQKWRAFDQTEGWRRQRVVDLDRRLDEHWAEVVLAAARAGDP